MKRLEEEEPTNPKEKVTDEATNEATNEATDKEATDKEATTVDFSGKGIISKNDLKTALIALGIYSITDDDFNLLYLELAGQPNKMIMYMYPGFKNYIEKHM